MTEIITTTIAEAELPKYTKIVAEDKSYDFDTLFSNSIPPIIYLSGSRGQGKTALVCKIAENYLAQQEDFTSVMIYAMGFGDERCLPPWIVHVQDLTKLPMRGLLIIDEAGLTQRPNFNELASISRHKQISIVFAGQTLKQIKPTELSQVSHFIYKKPSLAEWKRKQVRPEFKDVMQYLTENLKRFEDKSLFFMEDSDGYEGWFSAGLPSFWGDSISKNYEKW